MALDASRGAHKSNSLGANADEFSVRVHIGQMDEKSADGEEGWAAMQKRALIGADEAQELEYGLICADDLDELKDLHAVCFPVHYNDKFYADVARREYMGLPLITCAARRRRAGPGALSTEDVAIRPSAIGNAAATSARGRKRDLFDVDDDGNEVVEGREAVLVGAITAQVRFLDRDDAEQPLLARASVLQGYTHGCYVLTLATDESCRRQGVGSKLLAEAIESAAADARCGVVYLHVICYNEGAISFYERHGFRRLSTCLDFYKISGQYYDSYLYAYFLGSAEPAERQSPPSLWQALVRRVASLFSRFF